MPTREPAQASCDGQVGPPLGDQEPLGRFQPEAFLGRGGFGSVWRVRDPLRPEADLALKVLRERPGPATAREKGPASRADNLAAEYRVAARIRHPVLVEPLETGALDPDRRRPYLLMEFVQGRPLRHPVAEDDLVLAARDVLAALRAVHAAGWIHGDIHPGNILISSPGAERKTPSRHLARVLDLGLARQLVHGKVVGRIGGLPRYAAPELLRGETGDHRVDLYALGLVLLEALEGPVCERLSDHLLHTREGKLLDELEERQLSGPLGRLVRALLQPDPDGRLRSADEGLELLGAGRGAQGVVPSFEISRPLGEEHILQTVGTALERLLRGGRRLSLLQVEGADGLGKTRWLREAELLALARGIRCISWPQARLEVRRMMQDGRKGGNAPGGGARLGGDRSRERAVTWTPLESGVQEIPPEITRWSVALLDFLGESPSLLLVDDVDALAERPAELELLRLFVEKAMGARPRSEGPVLPVVMLAASPEGLRSSGLHSSWSRWSALPWSARVELAPWSPEECRAYLDLALPPRRDIGPLEEILPRESGGNAGRLRLLLRALAERRILRLEESRWLASRGAAKSMPEIPGERERFLRDWSELDETACEILSAAALHLEAAESVSLPAIVSALRLESGTAEEALRAVRATDALCTVADTSRPDGGACLSIARRFRLWILRATGLQRRSELRRRLARTSTSPLVRLWHSLRIGAVSARLVRRLAQPGDPCCEAVLARHVISRCPSRDRRRSAIVLGEALCLRGQTEQARRLLAEALRLSSRPSERAQALVLLGEAAGASGQVGEARGLLEEALSLLGRRASVRPRCLFARAVVAYRGRDSSAADLVEEGLRESPEIPAFHGLRGTLLLDGGDARAAATSFRRSLRLAEARGRSSESASAATNLARAFLRLGRTHRAVELLQGAVRNFAEAGMHSQRALALGNLGTVYRRTGDYGAAARALEEARKIYRELGDPLGGSVVRASLGVLCREMGLPGSARRHFAAADSAAREAGEAAVARLASSSVLHASRALLALELGNVKEAMELRRGADRFGADPDPPGPERMLLETRLLIAGILRSSRELERCLERRTLTAADAVWLYELAASGLEIRGRARDLLSDLAARDRRATVYGDLLTTRSSDGPTAARERAIRRLGRLSRKAASVPREARRAALLAIMGGARGKATRQAAATDLRLLLEEVLLDLPPELRSRYRKRKDFTEAMNMARGQRREDSGMTATPRVPPDVFRFLREILLERDSTALQGKIVDAALALTGAERGILTLREKGALKVAVARRRGGDLEEPERHFSHTILESVMSEGAARIASDAREDVTLRSVASVEELGLRSVLCVPLYGGAAGPLGALYLDNSMKKGAFGVPQLELAESFCAQAAIAWELAKERSARKRLVRQLRSAKRRIETELDITRREVLQATHREERQFGGMVGASPRMQDLFRWIQAVAPTDLPVLITGESGVGKELVARALHRESQRSGQPFVAENCGAVPPALLESILFGHEKGAFTGADRYRRGLFELAHEGTLFLDEIAILPAELQSRLLRVLQEGEVRPLGAQRLLRVDVRVVTATNEDLREALAKGKLRDDLYYRLQGAEVCVPPLRDRPEDIPDLVTHFLEKFGEEGSGPQRVSAAALERLTRYPWPGNVRELENEVRRAAALATSPVLSPDDLSPRVREGVLMSGRSRETGASPVRTLAEAERDAILQAMTHFAGHRGRVAGALGIARSTLYLKLREIGYS